MWIALQEDRGKVCTSVSEPYCQVSSCSSHVLPIHLKRNHRTALSKEIVGAPCPWGMISEQVALVVSILASSCHLRKIDFLNIIFSMIRHCVSLSCTWLFPALKSLLNKVDDHGLLQCLFSWIITKAKKKLKCINEDIAEMSIIFGCSLRLPCVNWRQQKQSTWGKDFKSMRKREGEIRKKHPNLIASVALHF